MSWPRRFDTGDSGSLSHRKRFAAMAITRAFPQPGFASRTSFAYVRRGASQECFPS